MVQMHDQHHPAGIQAPTSTPGNMDHSTNNHQALQNGGRRTLHQQQDGSWLQHDRRIRQQRTRSTQIQSSPVSIEYSTFSAKVPSSSLNTTIYRRSRHHRNSMRTAEYQRGSANHKTYNIAVHLCSSQGIRPDKYTPSGSR